MTRKIVSIPRSGRTVGETLDSANAADRRTIRAGSIHDVSRPANARRMISGKVSSSTTVHAVYSRPRLERIRTGGVRSSSTLEGRSATSRDVTGGAYSMAEAIRASLLAGVRARDAAETPADAGQPAAHDRVVVQPEDRVDERQRGEQVHP